MRNTKIHDVEVILATVVFGQKQVFGLEILVNHIVRVHKRERIKDLSPDLQDTLSTQGSTPKNLCKIAAFEYFHHQERPIVSVLMHYAGVVNRDDVWVIQLRDRCGLACESVGKRTAHALVAQPFEAHHLEGDVASKLRIECIIHLRKATFAEHAEQLVALHH